MASTPLYNIVFVNDDVTPMEFVVHVMQEYLDLGYDDAIKLMLRVHHEGKAASGPYEPDEAEARRAAILALAHQHNHPLGCILEAAP
jgi:ATP-dependent Clp protease adaptor protein ClpS